MKSDVYAVKAILESRLLKQEEIKTEEQQLLKLAKENPFDLELQCKIEEQIRSENLRHNLYTAMEHIPESFSSVSMLYIKLEINGCVVKAFVDSGSLFYLPKILLADLMEPSGNLFAGTKQF
jgi:tRNA splicing endonuclease